MQASKSNQNKKARAQVKALVAADNIDVRHRPKGLVSGNAVNPRAIRDAAPDSTSDSAKNRQRTIAVRCIDFHGNIDLPCLPHCPSPFPTSSSAKSLGFLSAS